MNEYQISIQIKLSTEFFFSKIFAAQGESSRDQ